MSAVSFQNKDITSKVFAEMFKGKSLHVYGIDIPEVKMVLPTNLPGISANELRMDNIFLLDDGRIAIIDYESKYKSKSVHKYIDYINRVLLHYEKEWGRRIEVRMIVIYTADVKRSESHSHYDAGCLKLDVESAYLSEIDKDGIRKNLHKKIRNNVPLTDKEMMEFILLPLAYEGNEKKNEVILSNADLARGIKEDETRVFLLSGLVVFCDKVINQYNANLIRRLIDMTKVGQLFADEMEQKLREKERIVTQQVTERVTEQVNIYNREKVMHNLRSIHPDWSDSRVAEETETLFA